MAIILQRDVPKSPEEIRDRTCGISFKPMSHLWENVHLHPLEVILDGTDPVTGERVHIVKGDLEPKIIRNALVIGDVQYFNMLAKYGSYNG